MWMPKAFPCPPRSSDPICNWIALICTTASSSLAAGKAETGYQPARVQIYWAMCHLKQILSLRFAGAVVEKRAFLLCLFFVLTKLMLPMIDCGMELLLLSLPTCTLIFVHHL